MSKQSIFVGNANGVERGLTLLAGSFVVFDRWDYSGIHENRIILHTSASHFHTS